MEPLGITLFCDDIRFEQTQKITFVGAYGPEMLVVGNLPTVLPKIGFYVQLRLSPNSPPPSKINIYFPDSSDDAPAITVDIAPPKQSEIEKTAKGLGAGTVAILSTNVPILLGPTMINSEGLIKVRVVCGDTIIKAGTLKVTRVDQLSTSAIVSPPHS